MRVPDFRLQLAPLLLAVVACAAETESGPAFAVHDSAGIRIVTTSQAEWLDPVELELPEPILTLPAPGSATPLSLVLDGTRLSDGRIAIVDGQLEQLVVYGHGGQEVFAFGREGDGPGEFRQAVSIHELRDGTIQIYDARLRRLTNVRPDGSLGEVVSISGAVPDASGLPNAWTVGDGWLLVWTTAPIGRDRAQTTPEAHVFAYSGALVRTASLGGPVDTLVTGRSSTTIRQVEGQLVWSHLFGARSVLSLARGQSLVLFSSSESHEIEVISLGGKDSASGRARYRFPKADEAIETAELDARRDRVRRQIAAEGGGPNIDVDFLFDPALQPDTRPAFRKVLWAPDGSIWAQRFEPPGDEAPLWWIVSPEGAFRGLVRMPDRSDILSFAEEHMLILRLDELGIPSIDLVPVPIVRE